MPSRAALGPSGRKLYKAIEAKYELVDHERALLYEAARTLDLIDRLVEAIGPEVIDVDGKVPRPVVELRQQRLVFGRLISALRVPDIDADVARPIHRPARGFYTVKGAGG
jgi:hypothetical protein